MTEKVYRGEVSALMELVLDTGEVEESDGCWLWNRGADKRGGYVTLSGTRHSVHRMVWLDVYGEIPDGDRVVHLCASHTCCNPEHMTLQTRYEAAKAMIAKRKPRVGVGKLAGKLDSIKEEYASGSSQYVLAEKYGVSQKAISLALRR